jgi:hypothetical protein
MKIVNITQENALLAYSKADKSGKETLANLLKGQVNFDQKITDRVSGYDDICDILGIHPVNSLPFPNPKNNDQEWLNSCFQISNIRKVLNEEWVADFDDMDQYKYEPIFKKGGAGFGFSHSGYNDWLAHSTVGSRLVYRSSLIAEFAGKTFIEIYNVFLSKQD